MGRGNVKAYPLKMADKYRNFEQLAAAEEKGCDYLIRLENRGSSLLIVAPHAGAIEPGTSELVEAVAGEDLSFYVFEGIKPNGNRSLHITSTHFDEPMALELIEACEKAIAFHGEESAVEIVYIGGRDKKIRAFIKQSLAEAGFVTKIHDNRWLQGISPHNICNRCRTGEGLQLEISRGLRESLFRSLGSDGRRYPTDKFDHFVRALRAGIDSAKAFYQTGYL